MWLLLPLACNQPPEEAPPEPGASCPDERPQTPATPPPTVLVLSIDTVNRDFLGSRHPEWDTTPTLDSLMAEGVRFDNVLVPRGLSGPALASLVTGAYPRTHTLRSNDAPDDSDYTVAPYPSDLPTLFERASAAGYTTWGIWSNVCFVLGPVDHRACPWTFEDTIPQDTADETLTLDFLDSLAALDPAEPLFAWVHFMDPHDPYERRDPWYAEFHPDTYTGAYEDPTVNVLQEVAEGAAYTDDDRRHVEAVYASQIRATDEHIRTIVDALKAAGRWDDTVVLLAFDHGEEMARRTTYFYHGCSVYSGVIGETMAIRAPGSVAAGEVLDGWIPSVDISATFADIVGLDWSGPQEGRSIWSQIAACEEPTSPGYFERGTQTAGIVQGGYKFLLDPEAGDDTCKHYDGENPYPGEREELYALDSDPLELDNLRGDDPDRAESMRADLCQWLLASEWNGDGSDNPLLKTCER